MTRALLVRCSRLVAAVEAVVLVAVDAVGLPGLLVGEDAAILAGEVTVVLSAHVALFAVDPPFLALKTGGFTGSELAGADALGDSVLLIVFALIDGDAGLREGGCGCREEGCSKSK